MTSRRVSIVTRSGGGTKPPKNNYNGSGPPDVNNDLTQDYAKNSLWFDTSVSPTEVYRCVDPAEGAAVWISSNLIPEEVDDWFKTKTTDDLDEGVDNLYYSTARVDSHLSGGSGINYNSGTISIDESDVDHNNLNNYNASEHIDWTQDQGAVNISNNNINKSAITQHNYSQANLGINGLLSINGVSNQDGGC